MYETNKDCIFANQTNKQKIQDNLCVIKKTKCFISWNSDDKKGFVPQNPKNKTKKIIILIIKKWKQKKSKYQINSGSFAGNGES